MSSASRPRWAALVLLCAVVASLLGGLVSAPADAAPRPTDDDKPAAANAIQVALDSIRPVVPRAGDDLRVTGRIVNTGSVALRDVSVQFRRSSAPLTTRKQALQLSTTDIDPDGGSPDDVPLPGTRVSLSAELAPGRAVPFALRVPIDQLGLPTPGTYVLAVEALGRQQGVDEFDTRLAVLRTFLPWYPVRDDIAPLDVVWLWPLADWPAQAPDGTLVGDRTALELSAGGRLDTLVQVGTRAQSVVSWIADPALLQTAAVMSTGYQVRVGDRVVPGDHDQAARRWTAQVADVVARVGLRTTPFADVDASALTRAGMSTDVVRAVTLGPVVARQVLATASRGTVYWAPFGRMDRNSLDVLASAGVETVVMSTHALPANGTGPVVAIPTSLGSVRAVLTDQDLGALVTADHRSATDVLVARQSFLAQTSLLAQTIPAQADRAVVVGPTDIRWTATASLLAPLLKATRTAPWLATRSLDALLAEPPPNARKRGAYGPKARAAELTEEYLAAVRRQSTNLDEFTSILDDPRGVSEPFTQALLRSVSAAWRDEPRLGDRLLSVVSDQLSALTDRVHVLSEGTITLSGDTGRVPVSIVNDLDRAVTVGVRLRGVPGSRLQTEPLTDIAIEPGKMASVDLDVRVVGGDPLRVYVELLTPEGEPFGDPAVIDVRTTAYARAASWVVAASFVAIAVFVVVGIVRRVHRSTAGSRAASPADDTTESAE